MYPIICGVVASGYTSVACIPDNLENTKRVSWRRGHSACSYVQDHECMTYRHFVTSTDTKEGKQSLRNGCRISLGRVHFPAWCFFSFSASSPLSQWEHASASHAIIAFRRLGMGTTAVQGRLSSPATPSEVIGVEYRSERLFL